VAYRVFKQIDDVTDGGGDKIVVKVNGM